MKKDKKKKPESKIDHSDEIKRLNRIIGQIEGVAKMLKNERKLDDVLTQCKAIRSAIASVESRIVRNHVGIVLDEVARQDKRKNREEVLSELQTLYKQAS